MTTSPEHNIATVQAALAAISAADYDALAATVTPDYERHDLAATFSAGSQEELISFIRMLKTALPDFRMQATKIIATEDDHVAVLLEMSGTHNGGDLLGMPPTGERIAIRGMGMYRFVGGLIRDNWQLLDTAALMAALSPKPEPATNAGAEADAEKADVPA